MKKRLLSLIVIIITSIIMLIIINNFDEKDHSFEAIYEEIEAIKLAYAQSESNYDSLDQLVKNAVVIVSGTVKDVSNFDDVTKEYLFSIDEQFKGESNTEEILIYEYNDLLTVGQSYLLFLTRWEGGLYPSAVHTTLDTEDLILIDDNKIKSAVTFLDKEIYKQDFFEAIKSSQSINEKSPLIAEHEYQRRMPLDLEKKQDLVDSSDIVVRLVPTAVLTENKYFKTIEVKVLEIYQDKTALKTANLLDETSAIYVPKTVGLGEEHILFLKEFDGVFQTTSSEGSAISVKDEDNFKEVLNILEFE